MNDGYVTFKREKETGNESVLRSIEATKYLDKASGADFAWPVEFRYGRSTPPDPFSEVFFRVLRPFPNTNIRELETISEHDFERSKASQKVARFTPLKDFQHAAEQARRLS